jgi:hypothetical protein
MPDIEFIGFGPTEIETAMDRVRNRVKSLPFTNQTMFLSNSYLVAQDINGERVSYLRIVTRDHANAMIFIDTVKDMYEVELVLMDHMSFMET